MQRIGDAKPDDEWALDYPGIRCRGFIVSYIHQDGVIFTLSSPISSTSSPDMANPNDEKCFG